MTATQLFVVPKSIPITALPFALLVVGRQKKPPACYGHHNCQSPAGFTDAPEGSGASQRGGVAAVHQAEAPSASRTKHRLSRKAVSAARFERPQKPTGTPQKLEILKSFAAVNNYLIVRV